MILPAGLFKSARTLLYAKQPGRICETPAEKEQRLKDANIFLIRWQVEFRGFFSAE